MKLGLLGGTFDPPHLAHVAAARFVRDRFGLDRVELTPAFVPPHKPDQPRSSPYHRYSMTVLATLGEPRLAASFRDLARGGVSYTIETLRETRGQHPESRVFFILGTDQFAEIASWREPKAIVEEFELIVVGRPGHSFDGPSGRLPDFAASALRAGRIHQATMDPIDLSSTSIRAMVRAGEPVAGLVGPLVDQYIQRYGLYRSGG